MSLSSDLISQFVKITNDDTDTKKETISYGTIVTNEKDELCVRLDGDENGPKIPVSNKSTQVKENDRVIVTIKNHTAIITGNLNAPATRSSTGVDVDNLQTQVNGIDIEAANNEITKLNILVAKKASLDELSVERGRIDTLYSDVANITELKADKAAIEELTSEIASINQLKADKASIDDLTAEVVDIKDLKADKADVEVLTADIANIENAKADKATVEQLVADVASIEELQATKLDAETAKITYATIATLESNYLTANEIESIYLAATRIEAEYAKIATVESDYAKINLANVSVADIGTVLANIGLITTATIVNGHVTGYLDSVEVNADNITAGTLTVDRLVISGTDKSIIYALNNSGDLVSTEVDTLDGDVITKRTISAEHIIAGTITANELHSGSVTSEKIAAGAVTAGKISVSSLESIIAKIGSFNIDNALYTNDHSTYNSAVEGVYIGSDYISLGNGGKTWLKADGSVSIGSGGIVYNAVTDTLEIVADSIKMGSEHVVTDADLNSLQAGGENLLIGSKDLSGVSPNGSMAKVVLDNGFTAFECVDNWKGVSFKANDIIEKCKVFDDFTFAVNAKSICAADLYFFALCFAADGTRVYPEYSEGQNNSYKFAEFPDYEQDKRYSTTFSVTQGWVDLIAEGGTVWWSLQIAGDVPVDTPVYLYAPKLERGNIPSDWSPNYADIETRILEDEANITILSDAINSTVGTTEAGWKKYTEMVQKYDSFTWTIDQTAVVATETQYALGSSSTTAPTSGWASSVTWTNGQYTWMKTRYKYANGSYSDWTTPVCITGNTGVNGKDATRTPDTIIHKDYPTTTYWEIAKATVPYNSSAAYGYIRVWGNAGAYESNGNGHVDLNVGFRSSPSCILTQRDSTVNTNKCNIVGYLDSDGYVHVYAVLNGYANATLYVEGTQHIIVNSTSTTVPTGTLIFDLSKMTAQNAQTATNYMNFSSSGLVIGDLMADTLGKNVLIDSDSVDIRNGETTLASFGADYLYLAKNSRNAKIDLCDGLVTMYHESKYTYDTLFVIDSTNTEIKGLITPLCLTSTDDFEKVAIQFANANGIMGGLAITGSAGQDGWLRRCGHNMFDMYTILDSGNFYDVMDSGWFYGGVIGEDFTLYSNDTQIQYRKIGKVVHIRGVVKPVKAITGSTDNHLIFTLPEGYRPSGMVYSRCQGSGAYSWLLSITTSGQVRFARYNDGTQYVDTSTTSWLPFNVTFFID